MKIYKLWWKKFAPDYESLKPDRPELELHTDFGESSVLETRLTSRLPQLFMLLFILGSACLIIWQLELSSVYKWLSFILVLINISYDIYTLRCTKESLLSLRKQGPEWQVWTRTGICYKAQLLAVSSILGMGYCLEIRVEDRLKSEFYCIWKLKSNQAFCSYCTQLRKIGFND